MPAFMGISYDDINGWICKTRSSLREGKEHTALWRTMCSLDIINEHYIRFNPDLSVGEDTLFVCEYFWHAKSVGILDKTLYYLVQRRGSANDLNNKNPDLMCANKIKIVNQKEKLANRIQIESGFDIRSYWQGNNVLSALQIAFFYAKNKSSGIKKNYKKYLSFYNNEYVKESIINYKYVLGLRAVPFVLIKHAKSLVFVAGVILPRKIISKFI